MKSIFIFLFVLISLSSCGIFFLRKEEPEARFCYFDPGTKTLIYESDDQEGIKAIEIVLLNPDEDWWGKRADLIKYPKAVNKIDLSVMDNDSIVLSEKRILIKIWDRSPVIEDYSIKIEPADWKQPEKVYSRYSTR
jgi:hypothetical protein